MEENVLLLCLSKVVCKKTLSKYVYNDIEVAGYMTNEAPAKIVLQLVDHLDRIVVISTKAVRDAINTGEPSDDIQTYVNFDDKEEKGFLEHTHIQYYEKIVSDYAKKINKMSPVFCFVNIPDKPEEYDIASAAVEAADKIYNPEKSVHLYIDYNGGMRSVAAMLLSVANLMEQRGVTIENILTMNYENKDEEGRVPVESFMGVLQSSRLVSGIKEYVDYGRCGELKRYFHNRGDSEIDKILDQMDVLSQDFQMCNTGSRFEKNVQNLRTSLERYIKNDENDLKQSGSFSVLFKYVAKDILDGYQLLFSGDLLNIIDWCYEKEYIQQAVTFYSEKMPDYFWDKHIYYPTPEEEAEYKQIEAVCNYLEEYEASEEYQKKGTKEEKDERELESLKRDMGIVNMNAEEFKYLKKEYLKFDLKDAWIAKYLRQSKNKDYEWMYGELRFKKVDWTDRKKFIDTGRTRSDYVDKVCEQEKKNKKEELHKILKDYSNIKQWRNQINHAGSEGDKVTTKWEQAEPKEPYKFLANDIREGIDNIRNFMKKG